MTRSTLIVGFLIGSFSISLPSHADPGLAITIGVTPESALVAGLTTTEASGVLGRLSSATEMTAAVLARVAAVDSAAQEVSELSSALAGAVDEYVTLQFQRQAASAQLQTARNELKAAKDALFEAITIDLSNTQIDRLQAWRDSVGRQVPASFRAVARLEEQWIAIEFALRAEARAIRTGEPLASELSQLLASVRSESDVMIAHANLTNSLPAMLAIFQSQ